jgi:hypothetical protein
MKLYLHSLNMPSWGGAQLKKEAQGLYLYFLLYHPDLFPQPAGASI